MRFLAPDRAGPPTGSGDPPGSRARAPIVPALLGPEPLARLGRRRPRQFRVSGARRLICLTETELFGHRRTMRRRPAYLSVARRSPPSPISRPGIWSSTSSTGSARYAGLVTWRSTDSPRTTSCSKYAEGARLYLPVQRMAAVTKYAGSGDATPRLDKLGRHDLAADEGIASGRPSARWRRISCASTPSARSWRASRWRPTRPWQHEFEAAFAFEETSRPARGDPPGQGGPRAPRQPMDRLVCGDVGYGKTEVAVRAAREAALDGHQVGGPRAHARLLAEQHWNTFRERFAPYPVRVGDALAVPVARPPEGRPGRAGRGDGGRRHRHPPAALEGRRLQRISGSWSWTRSTASVWRTRAPEAAPEGRPCPHAHRDPYPAHALHGDGRDSRPLGDRVAAGRSPRGRDGRVPLRCPR